MKPFVQIATRPEDDVALTERAAVLAFTGLAEEDLLWTRLDRDPFPDLRAEDISGIILCGSPFTVSDPAGSKSAAQIRAEAEIFRVLDTVIEKDVPFLGACYGIGTLGTHQGAVIDLVGAVGERCRSDVEISGSFSEPLGSRAGVAGPLGQPVSTRGERGRSA